MSRSRMSRFMSVGVVAVGWLLLKFRSSCCLTGRWQDQVVVRALAVAEPELRANRRHHRGGRNCLKGPATLGAFFIHSASPPNRGGSGLF